MDNRQLAKRVVSNVVDFDMHNLFEAPPLLTALQQAADGGAMDQPCRKFQQQPIRLQPDYGGNFLDKLKQPFQGKLIEAASDENLMDFSNPEEWLKHQEESYPRILTDESYEMSRPGEGAGAETLKQYWDRAWEPGQAPEMSEDLIYRLSPDNAQHDRPIEFFYRSAAIRIASAFLDSVLPLECGPDVRNVVAGYLLERMPVTLSLGDSLRIAGMKLDDFKHARRQGLPISVSGVVARLKKAEPRMGRWTFDTGAKARRYSTVFQFVPDRKHRSVKDLDVRVSCSCPSWVYWGAQFNAYTQDYLAGRLQITMRTNDGVLRPVMPTAPKERDPVGEFLVCKHVLACIPIVSNYQLGEVPHIVRKRLKAPVELKVNIPKGVKIQVKVPPELKNFGYQPAIRAVVQDWETMSPQAREKFISGLTSPGAVSFMAFKFPMEAAAYAANRLKELIQQGTQGMRKWAKVLLQNLIAGRMLRKQDVPEVEQKPEEVKVDKEPEEDPTGGKPEPEEKPEEKEPEEAAPVEEEKKTPEEEKVAPEEEQPVIPKNLQNFANKPEMRMLVQRWPKMSQHVREQTMAEMESPMQVGYVAYRFPDTSKEVAIKRLGEIAESAKIPEYRRRAKAMLDKLRMNRNASWEEILLSCC